MDRQIKNNQKIRIRETVYTLSYAHLYRPLERAEYARLRRSIMRWGVIENIVVDENNNVFDGAHRLMIASELGHDHVPCVVRRNLSDKQKIELASTLNEDRRHLTPLEQQKARERRLGRVLSMRADGASQRAIAEKEKISRNQVRADLANLQKQIDDYDAEEALKATAVKGRDGKTYHIPAREKDQVCTLCGQVLGSGRRLKSQVGPPPT
jgi:hypothetical protein